jgi:hypothetical protein
MSASAAVPSVAPGTDAHGVFVLDDVLVDCNERFCSTLRTSRAELTGKSPVAV